MRTRSERHIAATKAVHSILVPLVIPISPGTRIPSYPAGANVVPFLQGMVMKLMNVSMWIGYVSSESYGAM